MSKELEEFWRSAIESVEEVVSKERAKKEKWLLSHVSLSDGGEIPKRNYYKCYGKFQALEWVEKELRKL